MNYYCKVCGMQITNKSLNINRNAFLTEYKESKVVYCPFCGVTEEYIIDDYRTRGISQLNEETKKILDHAVKLELFNSDFYKKASMLAENQLLKLQFSDLAAIERMHANIHFKLGNFEVMPILAEINYDKYNTDELLVEQALLRERHAVAYYDKYITHIENEQVKEIMVALSKVEKDHIKLLY